MATQRTVKDLNYLLQKIYQANIKISYQYETVIIFLHYLMNDAGFKTSKATEESEAPKLLSPDLSSLPSYWNVGAVDGNYSLHYMHPKSPNSQYTIKCQHVHEKLLIETVDSSRSNTNKIELSVKDHIDKGADLDDFMSILRNVVGLCCLFDQEIISKLTTSVTQPSQGASCNYINNKKTYSNYVESPSTKDAESPSTKDAKSPSTAVVPPDPLNVGRDDLRIPRFNPENQGTEVSPNHSIFGGVPMPDRGPAPGLCYNPFGSVTVGRDDLIHPGIGRFNPENQGMEVGPNHPMFGGVPMPDRGPVPGARFDPFGPVTAPRFSGILRPPRNSQVFGEPDPDHLRMPPSGRFDSFGGGSSGNMF